MIGFSSIDRPLLVYDGDCGFCRYWVDKLKFYTGNRIKYVSYQSFKNDFHGVTQEDFARSIKLFVHIGSRMRVYSAAEAAFKALSYSRDLRFLHHLYKILPGFATVSELLYKLVSKNRKSFSEISKMKRSCCGARRTKKKRLNGSTDKRI